MGSRETDRYDKEVNIIFSKLDEKKVLETLSGSYGITGEEEQVVQSILQTILPFIDNHMITSMGNLIAIKKGQNPNHQKLMISTHIDEIGCVISSIQPGGFLRVEPRGGVDPKILLSQEMLITTKKEKIPAIFSMIPPHLLKTEERSKIIGFDNLILDTGLPEEEVRQKIQIGDCAHFKGNFKELLNQRFCGKSLDNRCSAFISILLLQELSFIKHDWDICCVFTTQEEVGCKGAETSANYLNPQIAIAIDVTFGDQPDISEFEGYKLGEGVPVGIGPNFTKKIVLDILSAGKEENIKTILEPIAHPGGTDAAPIQVSGAGVPTALLSVPIRYMHTPIEMLDMKDVKNAVKLLIAYIRKLDQSYGEALQWS